MSEQQSLNGRNAERFLLGSNMEPEDATAVVKVYIEVETGTWGRDATVAQAVSQAVQSANEQLRKLLRDERNIRILHAECVEVKCKAKREK